MHKTHNVRPTWFVVVLWIAVIGVIISLVTLLDRPPYTTQEHDFEVDNSIRTGSLILPINTKNPRALMIFVHGDGAMERDAFGYFQPVWKVLAEQGIASYSWDKAGVGGSGGHWLNQTMQDRADELVNAIAALKQQKTLQDVPIGLIGFSQAGWVMPKALQDSPQIAFAIFVSTPVNWLKQSEFLTQVRLQQTGMPEAEKQRALWLERHISELIVTGKSHTEYIDFLQQTSPEQVDVAMSAERYHFVQKNILADSQQDLAVIKQPIFVAFGDNDNNINVPNNTKWFEQIFANRQAQLQLKVYTNATHALLKNSEFGHLSPSIGWLIKMALLEEEGFTDGFLDDVAVWLNAQLAH